MINAENIHMIAANLDARLGRRIEDAALDAVFTSSRQTDPIKAAEAFCDGAIDRIEAAIGKRVAEVLLDALQDTRKELRALARAGNYTAPDALALFDVLGALLNATADLTQWTLGSFYMPSKDDVMDEARKRTEPDPFTIA